MHITTPIRARTGARSRILMTLFAALAALLLPAGAALAQDVDVQVDEDGNIVITGTVSGEDAEGSTGDAGGGQTPAPTRVDAGSGGLLGGEGLPVGVIALMLFGAAAASTPALLAARRE